MVKELTLDERKELDGSIPFYCKSGSEEFNIEYHLPITKHDFLKYHRYINLYRGIEDTLGYKVSEFFIYMRESDYKLFKSKVHKYL